MAKKGFRAVGIDISRPFLEDARTRAKEYGVSSLVTFLEGDARDLKKILKTTSKPFDVVVNAWTSVGFYSIEDDLNVFKQARELSREGGILFVAETMHTEFLSIKFTPTSFAEIDEDTVMLEDRKYDPTSGHVTSSWSFYSKRGENLECIDRVVIDHHVYSLSELCSLLRKAGWEPVAQYGSLVTLQPMNALTHMNVVARAQ
jgi:ubiquinone/menaquinone biosynthesis C-methylase UbiE